MTPQTANHRLQINLPQDLYQLVRQWAYEHQTSISSEIRKSISHRQQTHTSTTENDSKKIHQWQKFMRQIGTVKGHTDDSTTHDRWSAQTAEFHKT